MVDTLTIRTPPVDGAAAIRPTALVLARTSVTALVADSSRGDSVVALSVTGQWLSALSTFRSTLEALPASTDAATASGLLQAVAVLQANSRRLSDAAPGSGDLLATLLPASPDVSATASPPGSAAASALRDVGIDLLAAATAPPAFNGDAFNDALGSVPGAPPASVVSATQTLIEQAGTLESELLGALALPPGATLANRPSLTLPLPGTEPVPADNADIGSLTGVLPTVPSAVPPSAIIVPPTAGGAPPVGGIANNGEVTAPQVNPSFAAAPSVLPETAPEALTPAAVAPSAATPAVASTPAPPATPATSATSATPTETAIPASPETLLVPFTASVPAAVQPAVAGTTAAAPPLAAEFPPLPPALTPAALPTATAAPADAGPPPAATDILAAERAAAARLAGQTQPAIDPLHRALRLQFDPAYAAVIAATRLNDFDARRPFTDARTLTSDSVAPVSALVRARAIADYREAAAGEAVRPVRGSRAASTGMANRFQE